MFFCCAFYFLLSLPLALYILTFLRAHLRACVCVFTVVVVLRRSVLLFALCSALIFVCCGPSRKRLPVRKNASSHPSATVQPFRLLSSFFLALLEACVGNIFVWFAFFFFFFRLRYDRGSSSSPSPPFFYCCWRWPRWGLVVVVVCVVTACSEEAGEGIAQGANDRRDAAALTP